MADGGCDGFRTTAPRAFTDAWNRPVSRREDDGRPTAHGTNCWACSHSGVSPSGDARMRSLFMVHRGNRAERAWSVPLAHQPDAQSVRSRSRQTSPRAADRSRAAQFARYLTIAIGSARELDYHLLLANDLGVLATRPTMPDSRARVGSGVRECWRFSACHESTAASRSGFEQVAYIGLAQLISDIRTSAIRLPVETAHRLLRTLGQPHSVSATRSGNSASTSRFSVFPILPRT